MASHDVFISKEFVKQQYEFSLGTLINEKKREENKDIAREIAVTITETEKAYAYFMQYVYPFMSDEKVP